MYTATLFTKAKNWNQPSCSSIDDGSLVYITFVWNTIWH